MWAIMFVSGLGFTNGYLGSLAIIMVGEWVEDKYKGIAGTFVSILLDIYIPYYLPQLYFLITLSIFFDIRLASL